VYSWEVSGRGADLTGPQMRAHFTICPERPAASDHGDRQGRCLNAKRGRPSGRRILCGWRSGARLTASQMPAHFTICPKRPAGSDVDRAGRSLKVKRGHPAAADEMRLGLRRSAYPAQYARALHGMREAVGRRTPGEQLGPTREKLGSQAWPPTGAADAVRLALWHPTHG
jgi:hypothetical protein